MDPQRRAAFNAAYSDELFQRFVQRFEGRVGPIPFRVAETPLFMTPTLRDRLARQASEIVAQLSQPAKLDLLRQAVPARYDVPGIDALPNCVQVDFALSPDPGGGELIGKVVELQAFPSLYALMSLMSDAWAHTIVGLPGLAADWSWAIDMDHTAALALLDRAIVAGEDPNEVVIVDLEPEKQKTSPDFVATQQLFGVDSVCVTQLIKEGRRLFRIRAGDGKRIPVRRIFNRMVFDELEVKKVEVPFRWNEELDVTWCSHPNWYWIWSKFALPHIDHPAVPRSRYLTQLDAANEMPGDLSRYVLKPLFSFAGAGVVVDVTPEDVARIPAEQRGGWILQEKIEYAEALRTPAGAGVKAEVRVMLIRPPTSTELRPLICLVRLSRGKMLGVDFNKGLDWVGGSVGMWPR